MAERRSRGGHESGDTPVSELLGQFPEVLFRPGAGMATPEPQDASPPEPKELAPLDGLTDIIALIRRRWNQDTDGTGRPFLVEALESQAEIAVRNLRSVMPEDAVPEDAKPDGRA